MSGNNIVTYESWYTDPVIHDYDLADIDANILMDEIKLSEIIVTDVESMSPDCMNHVTSLSADTQRGPPPRNAVDTPFNFSVEIDSKDTNKKKYLYSHQLNRIYVDRECDFSVQFNWNSVLGAAMRVRACVVFADDAQAQKRPECCLQHVPQDMERHIGLNVLHSSRPQGTLGVEYHGAARAADSWLSTVVALSKPGAQPLAHAYKFVCKSSCSSGINRRAIAIIFTLEDAHGKVYGRQMVGARVCSCPRRDMQKDEDAEGVFKAGKKRVPANLAQAQAKAKRARPEVKVEPAESDERVLTLPALEIMGERAAIAGLEVMLAMTQQALCFRRGDPQAAERYQDSIAKLQQAVQDLKNKAPSE